MVTMPYMRLSRVAYVLALRVTLLSCSVLLR